MTHTYARRFWYKMLELASKGTHGIKLKNPAITFTKKAKAGGYDAMSDEEYAVALQDVEEESALYYAGINAAPDTVIKNAFECLDLTQYELSALCNILASASERVNFQIAMQTKPTAEALDAKNARFQRGSITPKEVYDYLCTRIYGQDEAKRQAATIIYNHSRGIRTNAIFAGPTGCGKSEIWRALSSVYPYIYMYDASYITANSWRGALHISTIFRSIPADILKDGVCLVLDELDKFFMPAVGMGGVDFSALAQANLLKLFDGDRLFFEADGNTPALDIDASNISVIGLGTFEHLFEHLKKSHKNSIGFGADVQTADAITYSGDDITPDTLIKHANVRREIAGRINSITLLDPMTAADFLALLDSEASPVNTISSLYGVDIQVTDDMKRTLAEEAVSTGLGVRYIRSEIVKRVDSVLFSVPDTREIMLDVTTPALPEMSP